LPSRRLTTFAPSIARQTIAAFSRRTPTIHRIRGSAPHWETPHEIHPGEWQDALSAIPLCDVRSADRRRLPARGRDASPLLRSHLLRGPLRKRRPASGTSCQSIMNWRARRPEPPRSRPGIPKLISRLTALPSACRAYAQEGTTGEIDDRRKGHCDESSKPQP
jgi:hypothetical protein